MAHDMQLPHRATLASTWQSGQWDSLRANKNTGPTAASTQYHSRAAGSMLFLLQPTAALRTPELLSRPTGCRSVCWLCIHRITKAVWLHGWLHGRCMALHGRHPLFCLNMRSIDSRIDRMARHHWGMMGRMACMIDPLASHRPAAPRPCSVTRACTRRPHTGVMLACEQQPVKSRCAPA